MRGFAFLLLVFFLILATAVVLFDIRYEHPGGRRDLDLFESIYAVFTLLFFGSGYPWPKDALTRALFFLVPMVGMAVVGQTVLGLASALVNRERWEIAVASTFQNHIIVCGLGKVGIRVVGWLRDLGEVVVVVESNQNEPRLREVSSWKIPVIFGDAAHDDVLDEANISTAASIVPCTNDDLANLRIATAARARCPGIRVVIRTFDDSLAANLKSGFDIQFAYSTSALAAPAFAAAALHAPVDYAFAFGESKMLLTITEFTVVDESPIAGYTVAKIEDEYDIEVLALQSPQVELNPPHDRRLDAGCSFVVSGTIDSINRVAKHTPATRELSRYKAGRWQPSD